MGLRLVVVLGLLLLLPVPGGAAERELVFGVPPYANPAANYRAFAPLAEHLSERLQRKVRLAVAPNYISHISRLGRGELDLALLGPSPYIKVRRNRQPVELLAKALFNDRAASRVVIVTADPGGPENLADLRGRTFAFGDHHSFGSHFLPRFLLHSHGISLADLAAYDYLGSHDNVALAVLHHDFAAGGLRHDIYSRYRERPLRIIYGPVEIPPPVLVVRADLPPRLKEQLREILYELEDRAIFASISPALAGFGPATDDKFIEAAEIINFFENH